MCRNLIGQTFYACFFQIARLVFYPSSSRMDMEFSWQLTMSVRYFFTAFVESLWKKKKNKPIHRDSNASEDCIAANKFFLLPMVSKTTPALDIDTKIRDPSMEALCVTTERSIRKSSSLVYKNFFFRFHFSRCSRYFGGPARERERERNEVVVTSRESEWKLIALFSPFWGQRGYIVARNRVWLIELISRSWRTNYEPNRPKTRHNVKIVWRGRFSRGETKLLSPWHRYPALNRTFDLYDAP